MEKKENQKLLTPDYSIILLKKYPELSPVELRICAYLRRNMSSLEIAKMTNRSVRTIEYTRTNIRKKMNLAKGENLVKHLIRTVSVE